MNASRTFAPDTKQVASERKVLVLSFVFGLMSWVVDALIDYYLFYEGTFWGLLVADVPGHELYVRSVGVALVVSFGWVLSRMMRQRNQAYDALRSSEEDLSTTLLSIGDAVISTDANGRVVRMNPVAEDLTGWALSEAQARPLGDVFRIVNEETRRVVENPVDRVLRDGVVVGLANHTVLISRDGTERPIDDSGAPIRDRKGDIAGVVLVFRDVTEQRRNEKRIRHLNAVLEAIRDVNQLITREDDPERLLKGACECLVQTRGFGHAWVILFGEDGKVRGGHEAGMGREFLDLFERLKEAQPSPCCRKALETGSVATVENPAALCPECPIAAYGDYGVMASLLRHRERVYGTLLVSVPKDHVGDEEEHSLLAEVAGDLAFALYGAELQKENARAAEVLRLEQERAQKYLDVAGVMFVALDAGGNVVLMNKKGCAVLVWEEGEILGKNWFETFLPKGMRAGVKEVFGRLMGGEIDPVEYYENPVVTKSGEERIIAWHNTLLRDAEGRITGTLSSGEDITERRRLEAHLQEAQKMEAIGTLAGGIAHDFNNLLSVVQGNVSLMLFDIDPVHPHYENLKTIEKQVRSGAELTRQLLGYARKGRYYVKAISLNEVVRETSAAFGKTRKDIVIQTDLEDGPCPIEADRGQIEQVVLNLYVNAADAMPAGGTLTLQTAHVTHEKIQSKVYEPKPGEYVLLRVSDTGSGMNEETRRRLFEPFFTTKAMGRGTGLGLASAYGIVKGHGGYIDVESQEGKGSTFRIFFPATKKEIEHTVFLSGDLVTGSGTILLVDDEELVLATAAKVLKRLGYGVIEARTGREAVELYRGNKDRIDMVVLDMIMPEMGGGEVFDKMKEINPGVKVLLSSGYSIDSQAKEILARGCGGFIQKPFSVKEFSSAVKAVLDS